MTIHNPACFANHLGAWAIETHWFAQAVAQVRAGRYPIRPVAMAEDDQPGPRPRPLYAVHGDVAVIDIVGPLAKAEGKYAQTGTVRTRQAIRTALADGTVAAIMLRIDSPGGTVAGTQELADDVAAASKVKPVLAHIDDLGASAAYWVGMMASQLTANAMAQVGSIGTVAVVEDTSKAAEIAGVVVHVVSTGPLKGALSDGAPVLPEHLAYLQEMITAMGGAFFEATGKARGLKGAKLDAVTTGRVWMAADAQRLGLIDRVASFGEAMGDAAKAGKEYRKAQRDRTARAQVAIRLAEAE